MTVPGGATIAVEVGFDPDMWQILPSAEPAGAVYAAQRSDLMPGRPIRSSGQSVLNGIGGNRLWLYNSSLQSCLMYVTASLGYPQETIATPVTSEAATAYKVLAELSIETTGSFNYQHPGGMLLIGCVSEKSTTAAPTLTAITAAGVAMGLLAAYSSVISNHGVSARWAYMLYVPPGTVQIVPTFSAVDFARFHVLSTTNGAAVGNESGNGSVTTPINVGIVNQYATSKAYALAFGRAGSPAETSGSILMDSGGLGTGNFLLHRVEQIGSYTFSYSGMGDAHGIAIVEVFI